MSLGIIATKRRIKSVNSTKKITKAMELVSTSKLKRCRDAFDRNSVYTSETLELVQEVLANVKNVDNQYLVKKDIKSKLYIVITSNLGLCGGYNANVFSLVKDVVDKENDLLIVGSGSGETFGILTQLRKAKKIGAKTFVITQSPNSSMAKEADGAIILPKINSIQHGGSQIEQFLGLTLDAFIMGMMNERGLDVSHILINHANLE